MKLCCDAGFVRGIMFISGADAPEAVAHVALQLAEYFDGRRRRFDLDLEPQGSAFLSGPGEPCATRSMDLSCPTASSPSAWNRLPPHAPCAPPSILISCRRILSAHGQMTGYSAGLKRKQALLAHENTHRLHPVVQLSPFLRSS